METIKINTNKPYSVVIGSNLLDSVGSLLNNANLLGKVLIVSDTNVEKLYLSKVKSSLQNSGYCVYDYIVEAGENAKSGVNFIAICEFLAQNSFTRTDIVIALGGGVVGDLTGFVASSYARGMRFVQIPTTLLALVDSSVGGKTAINLACGKNLVGAFYQPSLVVGDVDTLKTLPTQEFKCGMAEVIKYACIFDDGLFEILEQNDLTKLEEMVVKCINFKKLVVEQDEFDNGKRQLLNFGHTLGHAIEKKSDFTIPHGYAVAKGIRIILDLSAKKGICDKKVCNRVNDLLNLYGICTKNEYSLSDLFEYTLVDKKRNNDAINVILISDLGKPIIEKMSVEKWKEFVLG